MKSMDKVVCIKSYKDPEMGYRIIKGEIYPLLDVISCKCGARYNVGITHNRNMGVCAICGFEVNNNIVWFPDDYFRFPTEEELLTEELKEAVNQPIKNPKPIKELELEEA